MERDLQEKLKMYIVDTNGVETLYERNLNQRDRERQDLENSIKEKKQCRIAGVLNIPKVFYFSKIRLQEPSFSEPLEIIICSKP